MFRSSSRIISRQIPTQRRVGIVSHLNTQLRLSTPHINPSICRFYSTEDVTDLELRMPKESLKSRVRKIKEIINLPENLVESNEEETQEQDSTPLLSKKIPQEIATILKCYPGSEELRIYLESTKRQLNKQVRSISQNSEGVPDRPYGLYKLDFRVYDEIKARMAPSDFVEFYLMLMESGCIMTHLEPERVTWVFEKGTSREKYLLIAGSKTKVTSLKEMHKLLKNTGFTTRQKVYLTYQAPPFLLNAIMEHIYNEIPEAKEIIEVFNRCQLHAIDGTVGPIMKLRSQASFELYTEDIITKYGNKENPDDLADINIFAIRDKFLKEYEMKNGDKPFTLSYGFHHRLSVKLWKFLLSKNDNTQHRTLVFLIYSYLYIPINAHNIEALGLTSFILSEGETIKGQLTEEENKVMETLKHECSSSLTADDHVVSRADGTLIALLYKSVLRGLPSKQVIDLLTFLRSSRSSYKHSNIVIEQFVEHAIRNYLDDKQLFADTFKVLTTKWLNKIRVTNIVSGVFYKLINEEIDTTHTHAYVKKFMHFDKPPTETPRELSRNLAEFLFEKVDDQSIVQGAYLDIILNLIEFEKIEMAYAIYIHYTMAHEKTIPKDQKILSLAKELQWYQLPVRKIDADAIVARYNR